MIGYESNYNCEKDFVMVEANSIKHRVRRACSTGSFDETDWELVETLAADDELGWEFCAATTRAKELLHPTFEDTAESIIHCLDNDLMFDGEDWEPIATEHYPCFIDTQNPAKSLSGYTWHFADGSTITKVDMICGPEYMRNAGY